MTPCKEFREYCKACKHHTFREHDDDDDEILSHFCNLQLNQLKKPKIVFMEWQKEGEHGAVETFNECLENDKLGGMVLCPMILEYRMITQ